MCLQLRVPPRGLVETYKLPVSSPMTHSVKRQPMADRELAWRSTKALFQVRAGPAGLVVVSTLAAAVPTQRRVDGHDRAASPRRNRGYRAASPTRIRRQELALCGCVDTNVLPARSLATHSETLGHRITTST